MSLFEWLFERRDPQPTGTLDVETPEPFVASPPGIYFRGAIALAALAGVGYLVAQSTEPAAFSILAILYFVVAFVFLPKPDMSNTGIFGFIDHPFRWSDDVNRLLAILRVFLWPGRFVVSSLRDALKLFGNWGTFG